jgi:hypothetical protein
MSDNVYTVGFPFCGLGAGATSAGPSVLMGHAIELRSLAAKTLAAGRTHVRWWP